MYKYNVFQNRYNIRKSRVQTQGGTCRTSSGQSAKWTGFFQVLRPSTDNCHFTVAIY